MSDQDKIAAGLMRLSTQLHETANELRTIAVLSSKAGAPSALDHAKAWQAVGQAERLLYSASMWREQAIGLEQNPMEGTDGNPPTPH